MGGCGGGRGEALMLTGRAAVVRDQSVGIRAPSVNRNKDSPGGASEIRTGVSKRMYWVRPVKI